MHSFVQSFTGFFGASKFIRKNRLYYFYLIPFFVSLISYYFLFQYTQEYTQMGLDWLTQKWGIDTFLGVHADDWWGKVLNWIKGFFRFSLTIGVFFISMIIVKYILLALLSPWFAYISEKTEKISTGKEYDTGILQILSDAWRGVLISMRNLVYELSINLFCLVLGLFVPFLSPILFGINLYAGSYFFGFSMMDYVCERKRMNVKESVHYIRKNKQSAIGIGLGMWLLNFIPIFGLTYASVNGAVAASLSLVASEKN